VGRRLRRRRRLLLDLGRAQSRVPPRLAGPARVLVTQAAPSRPALELLQQVFGCGQIIENRRHDNHRHSLLRFSVKRRSELVEVVVPFFEAYPLVTAKRADFEAFASVLQMMRTGAHLHEDGLRRIAAVTERMNRRARSRYLESSEAIRRPARSDIELKIWS